MNTRIIKKPIADWFFQGKVLVLIGARQVGKTTFLKELIKEGKHQSLLLNADLPSVRQLFTDITLENLSSIIGDHDIIIIDEIQRILNPGLLLKIMVENFPKVQIIATGSSSLEIAEKIFEPLTGRQILFYLYPFSLKELYPKNPVFEIKNNLPFHLIHGLYPEICMKRKVAQTLLSNLANLYLYKDVLIWKDIRKPELLDKLLQLLAYQICSEVSINELAKQLRVKSETVENYLDLLEKSYVIFRLRSYSSNERKEVSKMQKIYFWDNGIRNAVINDFRPLANRTDVGLLWENFLISERMKMNAYLQRGVKTYFWRNLQQREVDFIEIKYQQIEAYEIKWNTLKNHKITRAFTNIYPNTKNEIITPDNFASFCFLSD